MIMKQESIENLLSRIEELENRLAESEQLIDAIKAGEVDAFAFSKKNGHEVYTLHSGDYAYRVLVENINEGALNLTEDGLIVYTNTYFCNLLGLPYDKIIGNSIFDFIHTSSESAFNELFIKGLEGKSNGEINL
jgi:PAS domain-containing protein